MTIQNRKKEHVELTLNENINYEKSSGFERYRFHHNAIPEVDVNDVDLSCSLLGRLFSFPLFVSSMTGGYSDAGAVNAQLASFCERRGLPMGVGSQRAMLENSDEIESFSIVRKHAPNAFIAANIGGAQLIGGMDSEKATLLIDSIRADALIIHLNPLQELMQPEGDRNFKGIRDGIASILEVVDCPVIVKETGAGISAETARTLLQMGVQVIDIAGAGGTSWSKVENLRERSLDPLYQFDDWGIPTVDCLIEVEKLKSDFSFELIASGGIRTSSDIVKSFALGADFTASAQPIIKALFEHGEEGLETLIDGWMRECRVLLTLLGCECFNDLNPSHLRII